MSSERSARWSAGLERAGDANDDDRRVGKPGGQSGGDLLKGKRLDLTAVRACERSEGGAFEAHLEVLHRRAGRIVARTNVRERVQPCRRLPKDKGKQREENDQRSAGCGQGWDLDVAAIL
jgi:hypothetical protein